MHQFTVVHQGRQEFVGYISEPHTFKSAECRVEAVQGQRRRYHSTRHRFPRRRGDDFPLCQNKDRVQSRLATGSEQLQVRGRLTGYASFANIENHSKQTHQRLRNLAKAKKDTDSGSTHSSECSICLMSIAVSGHVILITVTLVNLVITAMSIALRRTLFTRLALQMHTTHTQWTHMAKFSMSELSCSGRSRSRRRGTK